MIPGSNKDHPSFLKSFSYAMEGFVTAIKTERRTVIGLKSSARNGRKQSEAAIRIIIRDAVQKQQ